MTLNALTKLKLKLIVFCDLDIEYEQTRNFDCCLKSRITKRFLYFIW